MALTIAARSSPARRRTGEDTRDEAGWHPEHDAAPAGGSADATAAAKIARDPIAVAATFDICLRSSAGFAGAIRPWGSLEGAVEAPPLTQTSVMPWFLSGKVRMRLPVAAVNAFSTAGAATQIVGSPTPPQNPPVGMMIDSTFGIWAIRIES